MRSQQNSGSGAGARGMGHWLKWLALAAACLLALAGTFSVINRAPASAPPAVSLGPAGVSSAPVKPKHIFVINLENTSFDRSWGPSSKIPYLSQTLRQQGVLLENYFSIVGSSLPNYIAQISGLGPNTNTLKDCAVYHTFVSEGGAPYGQLKGNGCVYPTPVPTIASQLTAAKLTWKGYMEDMGTPCRHPVLDKADTSTTASINDQYVTRHNPFVYFASITDSAQCATNVVDLTALTGDLKNASTTPNLSYITPNVCNDGHDSPCVNGNAGGLAAANTWLEKYVPLITNSAAFKDGGALIITFDEADKESTDGGSVQADPGTPLPEIFGPGGGRVGALVLSPFVAPNTTSTVTYNHYSLLASMEDAFGLSRLGFAATPALNAFGTDVYNRK